MGPAIVAVVTSSLWMCRVWKINILDLNTLLVTAIGSIEYLVDRRRTTNVKKGD